MRPINEEIAGLDDAGFTQLVEEMFRDADAAGLILLLDRLTISAIDAWRTAAASGSVAVRQAWEQTVGPVIGRIGEISLDSLQFRSMAVLEESRERLGWIYDLRVLASPPRVTGEEWYLPQREVMAQVYTIGAYALFRQRRDALHALLAMQVCYWSSRMRTPLWSRGGYNSAYDSFTQVGRDIQSRPAVFARFLNDSQTVAISVCQFRLLVVYQLWCQDEFPSAWLSGCEIEHLEPIILDLLQPEISALIFGSFELAQFAQFVRRLGGPRYWQTGPIAALLGRYPAQSQEK